MKSIKTYLLACALCGFVLVSCGETKEEPAADKQTTEQQTTTSDEITSETATEETQEVTEEVKEEAAAPRDYQAQPLKGYVASLDDLVMGGEGRISSSKAKALTEAGKVLVFVGEGQIYFISDAGGNYARKGLIKIAGEKEFALKGKVSNKYGINSFIASNL